MSKQRTIAGRALRLAAVGGIALGALAPTAAHAAPCYPNACVSPATTPNDPGDPADPQVKAKTATKAATLPFTGGDAMGLAVIGVGAVAAGAVFVRQSRRKVHA